jgi:hypothetical protein
LHDPRRILRRKNLSDLLANEVKRSYDNFYDRVLKAIYPRFSFGDKGKEFELNVEDEKGPMAVLSKDPIQHKYPMIRRLPESTDAGACRSRPAYALIATRFVCVAGWIFIGSALGSKKLHFGSL